MATLLATDGSTSTHYPENPPEWTLEELQAFVDGYIEELHGPGGVLGFCNEEGRLREMPVNAQASRTFGRAVVGPVLVLGDDEEA